MGFMNLNAARGRMADADLDALLLLSPRHVYYATGYRPWFLSMYAEAGYGAAVVPGDPALSPGALVSDVEEGPFRGVAPDFPRVVTYPAWTAYADVPPLTQGNGAAHLAAYQEDQPTTRSGTIDSHNAMLRLAGLIRELRLDRARIGIEVGFVSPAVRGWLAEMLPGAVFSDATPLLEELRAIKSAAEVTLLRRGTLLAERAIMEVVCTVHVGTTANEIARTYRAAVMTYADGGDVTSARLTLRVGPHVLSPVASSAYAAQPGDAIFLDCGVEVSGYWADIGRSFVLGAATPVQREIYAALRSGFDAATVCMLPGVPVADLFTTGMAAVHASGLTSYVRGNVGHGVGLHPAPELPIVSREETRELTPGQVFSVEFPYYINGIGAFTLEDTFAITDDGYEVFNRLSHELIELDG